MSITEPTLDLELAGRDPGAVFSGPETLRDHPDLSQEQKIELLRRWAYDASELAVAEEEGMSDGEPSRLAEILGVLDEMTGGYDATHSPPTKQQGV